MTDSPLLPAEVTKHLHTRVLGRRLFYYPEIDSTNDAAVQLARGGEDEGTVVYADFQRRGRGRLDHTWSSPPRRDLLFTMILRPGGTPADALPVTLAVALALSVALSAETGERIGVKWPNDLVAGGAKIGGILAESGADARGARYAAVGVGLNVNSLPGDFPAGAVSCRSLSGRVHDRAVVLADVLTTVETYTTRFAKDGFAPLVSSYDDRLEMRDTRVRVARGEERFEGTALGVAADGALRVALDDGGEVRLTSETVEVVA